MKTHHLHPAPPAAPAVAGPPLLTVRDVCVRFGSIVALDGVSFDVHAGHVTGLIGPNGAGKTTLFNCLSRLYAWQSGDISFNGQSLRSVPTHRIAGLGIARTFQNLALFDSMTVLENVKIGGHCTTSSGFAANALRLPHVRREELELTERATELIGFLELNDVMHAPAGQLPFGTRKRIELARALMNKPRLLLLDEPAAGLNHEEVDALGRVILNIRQGLGVTVLLVEHHMGLVMGVSDAVVALDFGRRLAAGTPQEVQRHPDVIAAYLGSTP
ncbi:high-affinity branched-chain amino acid ABC transporter ATP-binding protein LivG [Rhodoferax koreense]|uniref:High-affinity branched-chain amino acid ABC transporter ATP-binding protein LivG n=1 Tax=Rhodoferax koreensis TaxID=1842727 RepID=A0A1P8K158_9BURK|nr:ABC transporter ATP-binding protein [Rhodoferax koreense]APW39744.1 high-affinity branched-chain amino acid ABC transporter ATP-binding protein LivG [Rhodoferax koreense]